MGIAHPGFDCHEAALRKAEKDSFFRRVTLLSQIVQQPFQQFIAAAYSWSWIGGEVIPGKTPVIGVGRVDEEVIQLWDVQHAWNPSVPIHAVAQPMQSDKEGVRTRHISRYKISLKDRIVFSAYAYQKILL